MPRKYTPKRLAIRPISPSIAYVPLSQGLYALIDVGDADWADRYTWHAHFGRTTKGFYAARHSGAHVYPKVTFMHTDLLGLTGSTCTADHINLDPLDNRRCNLRPATHRQQICNRKRSKNILHSPYRGVNRSRDKWVAAICINRKIHHLGCFLTPELARDAYQAAAMAINGEFTRKD